jgi:quercetin dioxygenase-like cupin family protein
MMPARDGDRGSQGVQGVEVAMESVNGATVILPDAGEAYVAMIGAMPADEESPPLHVHPHTDEAFYVAEGELTLQLGIGRSSRGRDRSSSSRGMVHTARNSGSGPMRGLLLVSPGGAEHIFQPVETS